jgi:hypothetical protein
MSAGTKRNNVEEEVAGDDSGDTGATVVDGGPGLIYMPFVVMEDLLDKLKLLNYEEVGPFYFVFLTVLIAFQS